MAAVAVAMAGCAIAAAWPVFPVLCASAVLTGGAGGVAIIAVQRHAARVVSEPAALRKAFSWLAIGLALSNVLGPVAAGFMIDNAGFRATFLAMATLPLLAWLSVRGAQSATKPPEVAAPRGGAWELWRDPGLRRRGSARSSPGSRSRCRACRRNAGRPSPSTCCRIVRWERSRRK